MKKCKYCKSEIDEKAKVCPVCKKDLRNFFQQHIIFIVILILMGLGIIISTTTLKSNPNVVQTSTKENKISSVEEIKGKDIELSAGKYIVGEDVIPGKYDVQAIKGMGNFFVFSESQIFGLKVNQAFSADEKQSNGLFGSTYNNLNLKKGDIIETNSNLVVKLIAK